MQRSEYKLDGGVIVPIDNTPLDKIKYGKQIWVIINGKRVKRLETPASRRNDPQTSYLAEAQITESGKRQTHQRIIREFVQNNPGYTVAEIGAKTGLGQHECSRRLSELDKISVQRGVQRRCAVKGTQMATWYEYA